VARLYTTADYQRALGETFGGKFSLRFHVAPPIFARRDAAGRPRKLQFGPWMRYGFVVLAKLKFLRGTAFDPFARLEDRRIERALIQEYRADVEAICARLSPTTLEDALALARLPEEIRGFGPIKQASLRRVRPMWDG